ncbi:pilus assembly protein PilZ [Vibrio sp. HA2012]|uniref:PilZ domain-containing protein n=1 Tax=Vibrio sp. HA2012 TaxID=1971595 RepID=UPI000C2C9907|nr:PilZ domain-containing protein [Vibrio sp. HA2012]PJC85021.1 pilus assembly protein PilZ [Vibrio sp. HA2012]
MTERRRFSRILYQAPAELRQGEVKFSCAIQDLSLHGMLLTSAKDNPLNPELPADVFFHLPESDIIISLTAKIIDISPTLMRTSIYNIDIDSISHLKRLVELNTGDEALLYREMEQLSELGDDDPTL